MLHLLRNECLIWSLMFNYLDHLHIKFVEHVMRFLFELFFDSRQGFFRLNKERAIVNVQYNLMILC